MKSLLSQVMKEQFNNLTLRPPLFYLWKYGIRFEISMPWEEHEDKRNLQQIKERTNGIFNKVFNNEDEMLLITDIHCKRNDNFLQKRPTKVYQKYIRDKELRQKLQHKMLPNVFLEDDDEEMVTHRFVLPCKKSDIRYKPLLTAISYKDFPHPSQILKGFPKNGIDIYFANVTRKMIYHLYDDRGCDVIASNKEDLRSLYEELNDWILDYDREQIDQLFDCSYYRHHRKRVIQRKVKISKQLGWHVTYEGQFAKGKVHCSCPMCSQKTNRDGFPHSQIIQLECLNSQLSDYFYQKEL